MKFCILCESNDSTGLALIAQARKIAPNAHITALVEGGTPPETLGACGADDAYLLSVPEDDCAQGEALSETLRTLQPDVMLFPATIRGRFLSAWVAARLETGLTADCTDLTLTEDGLLKQVRPAFGGNLTAEILCRNHRPQMASVRPGVFPVPEGREGRQIPVYLCNADESIPQCLRRIAFQPAEKGISLQNARVIVAGGKGVGSKAGFAKLAELADLLGGAVGATRSAVDAGWIGYEHQIGQTGVTVRPDFYIAVGISGFIQHTVGMNAAKTVLAINKDRNAPIFKQADYGIVSDWEEAVDGLIEYLKGRIKL